MFSNKQLRDMIVPLFLEQLLVMLVGIADTIVVSYVGEAAVSGVSLVNSFNTIFIYLFTALASGGAVIVSQYLGRKERENASEAVSQLLFISTLFSMAVMGVILLFSKELLHFLFGSVEAGVMNSCITYLKISAYSYPAIAVYNAGAALYRSVGKTSVTMYISVAANIINVIGNVVGVFLLHKGVEGVAYPSLLARIFSAAVITILCFRHKYGIGYCKKWIFAWNWNLQKKMLWIAVPNGIESGIFQFVKVALSSVVALFGTYQIAANGIAQSIWSLAALASITMGPVFITVIGQCMGSGDQEVAKSYFYKLIKITVLYSVIWNSIIFALIPLIMKGYAVEEETRQLVIWLVFIHNFFCALVLPFADCLGKGLRATGDVKFTTLVSIFTTVVVRLVFSILFGVICKMGVIGIAFAMCLDWIIRGIMFWIRFKKEQWKNYRIIS